MKGQDEFGLEQMAERYRVSWQEDAWVLERGENLVNRGGSTKIENPYLKSSKKSEALLPPHQKNGG